MLLILKYNKLFVNKELVTVVIQYVCRRDPTNDLVTIHLNLYKSLFEILLKNQLNLNLVLDNFET